MTLARVFIAALMVSLAACGDGGPGGGDDLPAAFTVMATREATVTDPCYTPNGDDQDFTFVNADTDAPEMRTTGLPVRTFSYGAVDSGWRLEYEHPDANPAEGYTEPMVFTIAASGGGRLTWKKGEPGSPVLLECDDAFTIDDIVAVE